MSSVTLPKDRYLLKTAEFAKAIGSSPKTVRNWRLAGLGPRPTRLSASDVRYTPEDIEAWVRAVKKAGSVQAVPFDGGAAVILAAGYEAVDV